MATQCTLVQHRASQTKYLQVASPPHAPASPLTKSPSAPVAAQHIFVAGRRRPEISPAPAARGGAPGGRRPQIPMETGSSALRRRSPNDRPPDTGKEHPCPWLASLQSGLARRGSASHRQELDYGTAGRRGFSRARVPSSMGVARSPGGGDAEEKNRAGRRPYRRREAWRRRANQAALDGEEWREETAAAAAAAWGRDGIEERLECALGKCRLA